jgi:CheY-like chemotaxis protein
MNGRAIMTSKYLVMFVDDDSDTIALLREVMGHCLPSIDIAFAANGKDAMSKIDHSRPMIVFTDMDMPIMNGHDLRASVKSVNKNIKIVAMTACLDAGIGFDAVFYKPFSIEGLVEYIKKEIEK